MLCWIGILIGWKMNSHAQMSLAHVSSACQAPSELKTMRLANKSSGEIVMVGIEKQ